ADVAKLNAVPSTDANFGATASVANLANIDASSAAWNKANNSSQTGTFTVSGYAPSISVPIGSMLTSASLTVKYQNTNGAGGGTDIRTGLITPKSASGAAGTPIPVTLPSTSDNVVHTATVPLYSSG